MKIQLLVKTYVLSLLLMPLLSQAEFYKWVDENGILQYSDTPQSEHSKKQAKLRTHQQKQIIIYTSDNCEYCIEATQWMLKNKLSFVEYNINKNRKASAQYQTYEKNILPLLLLNNEPLFGFGEHVKAKIKQYLKH